MLVLAPRLSSGTGVGMMTLSAEVRQTYGAHWGNGLGLQACTINKSVPTAIGGPNHCVWHPTAHYRSAPARASM